MVTDFKQQNLHTWLPTSTQNCFSRGSKVDSIVRECEWPWIIQTRAETSRVFLFTIFLDVWFFRPSFNSEYYTESSPCIKKNPKEPPLVFNLVHTGFCDSKPTPNDIQKYTSWWYKHIQILNIIIDEEEWKRSVDILVTNKRPDMDDLEIKFITRTPCLVVEVVRCLLLMAPLHTQQCKWLPLLLSSAQPTQ